MPDEINPTVPGEPIPAVVTEPVTPAAGGVATATPTQSPTDAEALRKEFIQKQETLQRDLNRMKSTFQSREAQLQQAAAQRETALKAELDKVRLSTMDEETRKSYENELAKNRVAELENQLQDVQDQLYDKQAKFDSIAHFKKMNVPDDVLITDGTLDDLLRSGWEWVTNRMLELNSLPSSPAPTPKAPGLPIAPKVDPGGAATPPSTRPSWADMEAKFGSRERVYQLFQEGRIPPSAMPE